jgi:class 3 adenylate cyclase/tetratricopeptide (TPR) repeat protein
VLFGRPRADLNNAQASREAEGTASGDAAPSTVCGMTCPACGAQVPEGARFCPECGQRLVAAPDERRLVTVLMADLVGYTSMAETADPEHIKNFVDRCFQRLVADVTAFGGRLDKIVGDQIVAQFGAPIAHEDDAERAVRAALRMRDTLCALARETGNDVQMRIGVNTGEVLVGALRAGGDPTVMGDVVNTAARLQTAAAPGQVLVGFTTYSATRGAVEYEALGPLAVKGREEPVEAFAAIATTARPGHRPVGRTPLIGRDAELGALRNVLDVAARRSRAHLILLYGDAGVGKSRLAGELRTYASAQHGANVLLGPCVPYGDTNVFAPIAEALRHACGIDGGATAATLRIKVTDAVVTTLDLPAESPETERLVEGLLYVIEGSARRDVDPSRARDDSMRAAITFIDGYGATTPLLLGFSDLHWAADPVLEFIDRLLARLRSRPIVVIGTARPGFETRWSPTPGRHNQLIVHLDALDDRDTRALIEALFSGEVSEDVVDFLTERSGGNPFFFEELAALVRDSAVDDGERPRLDSDALRALPATLHGLVAARLDALDVGERSLLEDCAIVGGTGSVQSALALAAVDEGETKLGRLVDRDLLVLDGDDFRFKSEVIREVAYGRLTKAERARRHAALVPILEAQGDLTVEQVAHHLATAAELVEEVGTVPGVADDVVARAKEALVRAADRAEAVESWIASGRFYERLLGLLPADAAPARWDALLGRARSWARQRELDRSRDDAMVVLEEARDADDAGHEAAALLLLGEIFFNAGEYDAAESTYAEAAQKWRGLDRQSGVANALRGLGMTHLFRGETDEADRLFREALASFRSSGDKRGEAWALQNLAWISFQRGATHDAEERLHDSADTFAELGDWGGLGWALGLLAYVRYSQGRLDEAAELAEQIAVEGGETGNRWAVGMMNVLLANVALWRGRGEECVERGRAALELFRAIHDPWGEVQAAAPTARALASLGRFPEYLQLLAELDAAAHRVADPSFARIGPTVAAAVAAQLGDANRALENVETEIDEDRDSMDVGNVDRALAYGNALMQHGRVDEALSWLEPPWAIANDDGPRAALGGLLAIVYAAAGRAPDALTVAETAEKIQGGTYSDRLWRRWGEGFALLQLGDVERGLAAIDDADAIAAETDSKIDQAIASLARAVALGAVGHGHAAAADVDARQRLEALGVTGYGWERVFAIAARPVSAPSSQ